MKYIFFYLFLFYISGFNLFLVKTKKCDTLTFIKLNNSFNINKITNRYNKYKPIILH